MKNGFDLPVDQVGAKRSRDHQWRFFLNRPGEEGPFRLIQVSPGPEPRRDVEGVARLLRCERMSGLPDRWICDHVRASSVPAGPWPEENGQRTRGRQDRGSTGPDGDPPASGPSRPARHLMRGRSPDGREEAGLQITRYGRPGQRAQPRFQRLK